MSDTPGVGRRYNQNGWGGVVVFDVVPEKSKEKKHVTKKEPTITHDEWRTALKDAMTVEDNPSALTVKELAALFGHSERVMRRRIDALLKTGRLTATQKRDANKRPVQAYLLSK